MENYNGMDSSYNCTNESLSAIMRGLDIQSDDRVLAICGSGDQAFAMVEVAERVVTFDCFKNQVGLLKKRLWQIRGEDFDSFYRGETNPLALDNYGSRNRYFTLEKLMKIRKRLDRLHFFLGNLYTLPFTPEQDLFTKIYLSNAFGHCAGLDDSSMSVSGRWKFNGQDRQEYDKAVQFVVSILSPGGLIYAINFHPPLIGQFNLREERGLTEIAVMEEEKRNNLQFWNPKVVRKS